MTDILTRLDIASRRTNDPELIDAAKEIRALRRQLAESLADADDVLATTAAVACNAERVQAQVWTSLAQMDWDDRRRG